MEPEAHPEPRWPASVALVVCAGLYLALPDRLVVGPKWVLPVLIVLPLIPLSAERHRHPNESRHVRRLTLTLIALVTVANVVSMALLVQHLLQTHLRKQRNQPRD